MTNLVNVIGLRMTRRLLKHTCVRGLGRAFLEMIRSWGLLPNQWFNPVMDTKLV
jgi:hypothetical protein